MSAHDLLNLLNEMRKVHNLLNSLRKRNKMLGKPHILSLFRKDFKNLIIIHKHDCKILFII